LGIPILRLPISSYDCFSLFGEIAHPGVCDFVLSGDGIKAHNV
jgi:hypothetical protein